MTDEHETEPRQPASKSERKREATRLQALGRRLTEMSADQLEGLALPDKLHSAILDHQRFPSHEAKRRQLQYIGRLMRSTDTEEIAAAVDHLDGQSADARYAFHQLEQWRDRLLNEADALTEYIDAHPEVDRQQLRHLVTRAQGATAAQSDGHPDAQSEAKRKEAARELFRFLRDQEPDPSQGA